MTDSPDDAPKPARARPAASGRAPRKGTAAKASGAAKGPKASRPAARRGAKPSGKPAAKAVAPARAARPAQAAAAEASAGVPSAPAARESRPALKKREFVDRVAKAADARKKTARPIVEATLAELVRTLADGQPLNLGALGKISVNRARGSGGTQVLICRIRLGKDDGGSDAQDGDETLAEPAA